jgi:hypothetical protein
MKSQSLTLTLAVVFLISLFSCTKENAANINPAPATKGSLLIWTSNPGDFTTCGPTLLVTLSNGEQSTIINSYATKPTSCLTQFGGYFSLTAGTYTYTVTSLTGCITFTGTVTIIAGICNFSKIH